MNTRLSWNDVDRLVARLTDKVRADSRPDILVAVQRGGLIPVVMLSHRLGVRDLIVLNIGRTVSDEVNAGKGAPSLGPSAPLNTVRGKDVLVIDDVVGSGATIRLVRSMLSESACRRIRCGALVVNVDNWESDDGGVPNDELDYIGLEVGGWVIFPWEGTVSHG